MTTPTLKNDLARFIPFASHFEEVTALNTLLWRYRFKLSQTTDHAARMKLVEFIEGGHQMRRKLLRLIRQNGE